MLYNSSLRIVSFSYKREQFFFSMYFLGFWHSCRAVQRYFISSSTRWKHRWNLLYWQRGSVWHLLQNTQVIQPNIRGLESSSVCDNEWRDYVPALSRSGKSEVVVTTAILFPSPYVPHIHTIQSSYWGLSATATFLLPVSKLCSRVHVLPDVQL